MQLHRIVFYRPRSHPHHRSEELARSRPERLEPRRGLLRDTERPYAGGTPCPTAPELGPCAQTCLSAVEPVPSPATAAVPLRPSCRSGHAAQAGENDSVRIPTSIVRLSDSSKYDKIG